MWMKRMATWVFGLVSLYLIVVLGRDVWRMWQADATVDKAQEHVNELAKEKVELEHELKDVNQDYVEQEARDQLNLVKEGEVVVVLPTEIPEVVAYEEQQPLVVKPWWQVWWEWVRELV